MFLASRESSLGLETILVVSAAIFGIGLIGFSVSRVFWLSCGMMIVSGCGMMVHLAAANTLVETLVDDDKRGRVMSSTPCPCGAWCL